MLQVKCNCGLIAEVRNRKNGAKLAYIHCVNGCGGIVSTKRANEIKAQAIENIGVKGEKFQAIPKQASETSEPKQPADFKPENEDLEFSEQPAEENQKPKNEPEQAKQGTLLKVVAGLLGAAVFGGGVYSLVKMKG
jgi:hypothetical protein